MLSDSDRADLLHLCALELCAARNRDPFDPWLARLAWGARRAAGDAWLAALSAQRWQGRRAAA